jgi:hypothetical protein
VLKPTGIERTHVAVSTIIQHSIKRTFFSSSSFSFSSFPFCFSSSFCTSIRVNGKYEQGS